MTRKQDKPVLPTPAGELEAAAMHRLLGYQMAQAAIATTAVFSACAGKVFDLRPVEYTLLCLVHANPGTSLARLAQALAVSAPNVTVWVDRLESRGLVRRRQSEADRRMQQLRTTDKGAQLAGEATQRLLDGEARAFAKLSDGERAILVELLHKVACQRPATER